MPAKIVFPGFVGDAGLKGEDAVLMGEADVLLESLLSLGIEVAAGVGVEENVTVGHLVECLEDDLGVPAPVAVSARAWDEMVFHLLAEVGIKIVFSPDQGAFFGETEGARLTADALERPLQARIGKR